MTSSTTTAAAKRLIVCGGNGFVGSRICQHAVARGWDVTSISRSGNPVWQSITSSASPPSWAHKVSWERGDLLRPATYASLLQGADYVVHSMGILLEADYKKAVSGQESPITGLKRAFSSTPRPGNPLDRKVRYDDAAAASQDIRPPETKEQLTYENMNRDSAIMLAKVAADAGAKAFAYMSAAGGAPVLPARYIKTKREAEETITREFPAVRGVYIRAPFMYDSSRPITMAMAGMTAGGALFNGITGGVLGGFMGAAGVKPLKADLVAQAVVEALEDESVRGPVEVPQIEDLATRAWRKEML
ncbi:uncharacterized protein B0I36DRAFT_312223 [Microdochium trichocladiopsis]|uniref:NAD-dependent epimerase/dehydratase domain-containing protein n=1 Tax=Microdochium trichocladiopsis TaxID=1682393 RepID=A0A9P8YLD6_9PEZI|nr:uncharacterized protein B0I36DRAFT_312223 [Microdochium trichocladiopsis]KAH7041139.1 hypothetical protein B0I36DRAFT_312223 [Microdochium trichocladiopsis]